MPVTCKSIDCTNPEDFPVIETPPATIYLNDQVTSDAGCSAVELESLTYTGILPVWISIDSNNDLVGAAGFFSSNTSKVAATARAQTALDQFLDDAVAAGDLECRDCDADIRMIFDTAQGANRDLDWQLVVGVTEGSITYLHTASPNLPLLITVAVADVTVRLATDGASVITTIANDIITAINSDADASAILEVSLKSGSDGTGVVQAVSQTELFSGCGDTFECQPITSGVFTLTAAGNGWSGAWSGLTNVV